MSRGRQPNLHLQFLPLIFAGWVNRRQQAVLEYLQAENESLREQLSNERVLRGFGLVRFWGMFVIDVCTLRVHVAGNTEQPGEVWMKHAVSNLTDGVDGFLSQTRYLILDRDSLHTKAFRTMLNDTGVEIVLLPNRSPNLHSYAERWVRSLRDECLRRIIPLGEKHLRRTIALYVEHYHMERNHQGLGNRLIEVRAAKTNSDQGRIRRRQRLGGLPNSHYRDAA